MLVLRIKLFEGDMCFNFLNQPCVSNKGLCSVDPTK